MRTLLLFLSAFSAFCALCAAITLPPQEITFSNSGGNTGDNFGLSVSIDNGLVVVGAPNHMVSVSNQGEAYFYDCSNPPCLALGTMVPADAASGDHFGTAVYISGNCAYVGSPAKGSNTGEAYYFFCDSGGCTQQSTMTKTIGASSGDFFGSAISAHAFSVAVGAYGSNGTGQVFMYVCDTEPCSLLQAFAANDSQIGDNFGFAVDYSSSAYLLVVGANGGQGRAYLFDCHVGGICSYLDTLVPSSGVHSTDSFGTSVALSGTTVVIGAPSFQTGGVPTGAAFVFDCSSIPCQETSVLVGANSALGDQFGFSVSISGYTVVVGAPNHATNRQEEQGEAYVFDCTILSACVELSDLFSTSGGAGDQFGRSVSISGYTILVSAPTAEVIPNPTQGFSYIWGLFLFLSFFLSFPFLFP